MQEMRRENPFYLDLLVDNLEAMTVFLEAGRSACEKAVYYQDEWREGLEEGWRRKSELAELWREHGYDKLAAQVSELLGRSLYRAMKSVSHVTSALYATAVLTSEQRELVVKAESFSLKLLGRKGPLAEPNFDQSLFAGSEYLALYQQTLSTMRPLLNLCYRLLGETKKIRLFEAEEKKRRQRVWDLPKVHEASPFSGEEPPILDAEQIRAGASARKLTKKAQIKTAVEAGGFRVVNGGNFDEAQIYMPLRAIERAGRAYREAGLGEVCYGQITLIYPSSGRPERTAYYMGYLDELFVCIDTDDTEDALTVTLCHELGHRYHRRKIGPESSALVQLYEDLAAREAEIVANDPTFPAVGSQHLRLEAGDKRLYAVVTDSSRAEDSITYVYGGVKAREVSGDLVRQVERQYGRLTKKRKEELRWVDIQPVMGTEPITQTFLTWRTETLKQKPRSDDASYDTFVTWYAQAAGFGENFAEMMSFYVLGRLPPKLVERLEKAVPKLHEARVRAQAEGEAKKAVLLEPSPEVVPPAADEPPRAPRKRSIRKPPAPPKKAPAKPRKPARK